MQPLSANAARRWATGDVEPARRLDYWVGAICEGFLEMDASSAAGPCFEAELVSAPLGPLGVNRVRASAQDVYRTRRGIAHGRDNFYYLLCQRRSAWVAAQDGRAARLLPGDVVLVDSRRCYEFHFPDAFDIASLELPIAWVDAWLPRAREAVASRIDGSAGWGQALSAFVRQLQPELSAGPPLPAPLLVDQLGALLALAMGAAGPPSPGGLGGPVETPLSRRVLDAIRDAHAQPGLTAAAVARQIGVSERSLHRCLAGSGATFAAALIAVRMATARRMLEDRRFDRLAVGEIGRRVGLCDPSHFVRLCRRHLGATPGVLRQGRGRVADGLTARDGS